MDRCASKRARMDAPSAKLSHRIHASMTLSLVAAPMPNSEQVNMPVLVATMCPCTSSPYGVDSKTDTRRIGDARFNPARSLRCFADVKPGDKRKGQHCSLLSSVSDTPTQQRYCPRCMHWGWKESHHASVNGMDRLVGLSRSALSIISSAACTWLYLLCCSASCSCSFRGFSRILQGQGLPCALGHV